MNSIKVDVCPNCDGDGKVNHTKCLMCKGTGIITSK